MRRTRVNLPPCGAGRETRWCPPNQHSPARTAHDRPSSPEHGGVGGRSDHLQRPLMLPRESLGFGGLDPFDRLQEASPSIRESIEMREAVSEVDGRLLVPPVLQLCDEILNGLEELVVQELVVRMKRGHDRSPFDDSVHRPAPAGDAGPRVDGWHQAHVGRLTL